MQRLNLNHVLYLARGALLLAFASTMESPTFGFCVRRHYPRVYGCDIRYYSESDLEVIGILSCEAKVKP